jgi:lipoprotein NlpD
VTGARVVWLVLALAGAAGCGSTGPAPVVDRPIREGPDYATAKPRARPAAPAPTPAPAPAPASASAPAQKPAPSLAAAAGPPREAAQREADWRPDSYAVKKGDTLYSIALDHGLAYRDVAAWNGLTDPNVIRVGQSLRLTAPPGWRDEEEDAAGVIAKPAAPEPDLGGKALDPVAPPPTKSGPKGVKVAYSEQALARLRGAPVPQPGAAGSRPAGGATQAGAPAAAAGPAPKSAPSAAKATPAPKPPPAAINEVDGVAWAWPARGKVLHGYNQGPNPKGVAIGGSEGQPVLASAPGKIVYAGSGLRGYGKLVIIKHNDTYLSVYAHNRTLLVREGDRVVAGQKIAEMGSTDSDRVGLHFEIRKLGQPVDPLRYLPPEAGG